jgi:hypothetical protein
MKKNITLLNRFNELASGVDENNGEQQTVETAYKPKEYKPPAVFLKNFVSYPKMIKQIKTGMVTQPVDAETKMYNNQTQIHQKLKNIMGYVYMNDLKKGLHQFFRFRRKTNGELHR